MLKSTLVFLALALSAYSLVSFFLLCHYFSFDGFGLFLIAQFQVIQKRDTSALIKEKFGDFKDGCFPRGSSNGCTCTAKNLDGSEATHTFNTDVECKKPIEGQYFLKI